MPATKKDHHAYFSIEAKHHLKIRTAFPCALLGIRMDSHWCTRIWTSDAEMTDRLLCLQWATTHVHFTWKCAFLKLVCFSVFLLAFGDVVPEDQCWHTKCDQLMLFAWIMSANLGGQLVNVLQSRQGQVSVEQILQVFYQTCSAVHHMHKQQPPIIHRDLKVCIQRL